MADDEFLLNFPLRIVINSDVGCPLMVSSSSGGPECLPIFTDEDVCDRFMNRGAIDILQVGESIRFGVVVIESARDFAEFFDSIEPPPTHLIIDPSGKRLRGLVLPVKDVLSQFKNADF